MRMRLDLMAWTDRSGSDCGHSSDGAAQRFTLHLEPGHVVAPVCQVSLRPGDTLLMRLHHRRRPKVRAIAGSRGDIPGHRGLPYHAAGRPEA